MATMTMEEFSYEVPSDCSQHVVTMPLNCEAHNYEHLVGYACWNCLREYFFADPFADTHPAMSVLEEA